MDKFEPCIFDNDSGIEECPNCGSTLMSFDGLHSLCAPCAARLLAAQTEALEAAREALEKTARWLESQAKRSELQAQDTRFLSIVVAAKKDAENFRAMAKELRAALDKAGKP